MDHTSARIRLAPRLSSVAPSPMLSLIANAAALRAEGRDIISLAAGEPDFDTPDHIQDAACLAIRSGDTHYTAADGTRELKKAVQRKFARENQLNYSLNEITVGSGAKQVIFNALAATVSEGDEVILTAPFYPSYVEMTRMNGGIPVIVPTTMASGFRLNPADLEAAITPRTRWLVLNSPSNPTGTALSERDLEDLAEVLLKHSHILVLADDIYEHLLFTQTPFQTPAKVAPPLKERTLTVNGVSKAYCMTGWRIGYAGGPAKLIEAMGTVQSQVTSCPSSISQAAAIAALDGPQDVLSRLREIFQERRNLVVEKLNAIDGLHCPVPEGAFYVFPSCEALIGRRTPRGEIIQSDTALAKYLLDNADVAVVPGSAFGNENHIRISYATSSEQLELACIRIADAIAALN
ncbi:pyridoxal phosphate-dependent aminotransferase [Chelativorans sp. Marseille-P2723]|uniref:pyridoxal phosphate-dependent aminotransferase n=1 Tax=Chelativorans sp. Marseille-P2723 TaxID=2709133 RepID=UPI00156F4630|nr:pyridoxal phosphate-dependent aminotransferase [Chelativorans sp. Marseille-P2723]